MENVIVRKEILKIQREVLTFKSMAEANIVGIFYKNVDMLRVTDLSLNDFSDNTWKVYYAIANEIINKEKK